MRKWFVFWTLVTIISCTEEEVAYTGSLTIYWNPTTVNGAPLNQFKIGVFDMSSLANYRFLETEAVEIKTLDSRVDFIELNPGNYVVALIELPDIRKVGQVKVGKQTTVILQE